MLWTLAIFLYYIDDKVNVFMKGAQMEANQKLSTKHFYLIILACGIIILCEALQVMIRVRTPENYQQWLQEVGEVAGSSFQVYLAVQLSYFMGKIVTPMMLGLHTYIAFVKIRVGKLFVFIWVVLMLGSMAYTLVEWTMKSPFYWIKLISYILAVTTILNVLGGSKHENI